LVSTRLAVSIYFSAIAFVVLDEMTLGTDLVVLDELLLFIDVHLRLINHLFVVFHLLLNLVEVS
jgi:hypothetical protein